MSFFDYSPDERHQAELVTGVLENAVRHLRHAVDNGAEPVLPADDRQSVADVLGAITSYLDVEQAADETVARKLKEDEAMRIPAPLIIRLDDVRETPEGAFMERLPDVVDHLRTGQAVNAGDIDVIESIAKVADDHHGERSSRFLTEF
jgi:hypothetical protein